MEDFVAAVHRFIDAVDWRQRWLWGLGAYFVVSAVVIVAFRNRARVQAGALLWCLIQVIASQPLNAIGAAHWRRFASANYFTSNGLFVALVWGLPLLALAVLCTVFLLISTARLAVQAKRLQLQSAKKQA